jgi:hypothetical protein
MSIEGDQFEAARLRGKHPHLSYGIADGRWLDVPHLIDFGDTLSSRFFLPHRNAL